jgi:hypothetical protein
MKKQQGTIIGILSAAFVWTVSSMCGFSEDAKPERLPARIVVAKVIGDVNATNQADKTTRSLKQNDVIFEKYTVNVGSESSAVLIFANGAAVNIRANSSLVIANFLQDPFSEPYSISTATEEPTTSITNLNLTKGEVVCNVKKLHIDGDKGSSFVVNTPVGAAGVRGTTFSVRYIAPAGGNGKASYILSVTEGAVSLSDSTGNSTLIPSGRAGTITAEVTTDPVTGAVTITEITNIELIDVTPEQKAEIQAASEEVAAVEVNALNIITSTPQVAPPIVNPEPTSSPNP